MPPSSGPPAPRTCLTRNRALRLTRQQVYKSFHAIANLADRSDVGEVTIMVEGSCQETQP